MTQPAPNPAPPAGGPPPANPPGGTPPTGTPPADPAGATPPGTPPAAPAGATPPAEDQALGPAGLKALQAERDARKKLEDELAPLKKLAAALGADPAAGAGKTDVEALTERLTSHEKTLAEERAARWRAEVANEKQLSPDEAARLRGTTKEELVADADALLAVFAARQAAGGAGGSRGPAPDPSQGARGSSAAADTEAQIKEAQAKGDWKTVLRLQNEKLHAAKTP